MKYAVVFLAALVISSAFVGQTEAAPSPDFGKEVEGVGQRVFAAMQKLLPVAQGYVELYEKFKKKSSEEDDD